MSKIIDSIIGHAIGDAMGVPTEFCSRERLLKEPVVDMIGSTKTGQPLGSWSDDTSMEIATISSIIEKGNFDYNDIMDKWTRWINNNEYTANNDTFDVGRTCLRAIKKYNDGIDPLDCGFSDINSNGNGSLMRILPVGLYSYYKNLNNEEIIELTNEVSSLTHSHDISKLACFMYVKFIINLLSGKSKKECYKYLQQDDYSSYSEESIKVYDRLINGYISKLDIDSINSSGYVVDTWECSLWILLNSNSYKECIIASTNIGQDTDTIGAITGSMAGIIYGIDTIPKEWLNKLMRKDYLIDLASKFEDIIYNGKKDILLGTIIGDIAGSRFELNNNKNKNFELLHPEYSRFTDDTVMTLAVAKTLLNCNGNYKKLNEVAVNTMVEVGRKYPQCGYGKSFFNWINKDNHEPYGSYGNGAAMRVSAISLVTNNVKKIKNISKIITDVSHNHEDSEKGAEAVCMCIHLALNNKSKEEIKKYIEDNYYKLDDTVLNLSKNYKFSIKCSETVKPAIIAFLESTNFEDAIRNAISIGGDSDTIGAITGSIAGAYYKIPECLRNKALSYLDDYLKDIYKDFNERYNND